MLEAPSWSLFALALVSACTSMPPAELAGSPESAPVSGPIAEPSPASTKPPVDEKSGRLEIAVGKRLRFPTDFAPSREVGMTDEPTIVGWSGVADEFVVCTPSGGAVCDRCEYRGASGSVEVLGVGEDCGSERVMPQAYQARLAAGSFAIRDGDWAYGAELVLVVAERRGEPDIDGIDRGVVEIGVRRRTGDEVVWVERIDACDEDGYCAPDVHIDAIAPSIDGKTIAVLLHSFAGEYSDTYPLLLLDAEALAAAVGE